jgi:glyoxylase-like metal-dependent hydrolase (beta-lactamase superfamily II)
VTLPPNAVWRLRLRGVNAYLVSDDGLTLVDAGTPWDAKRLRKRLDAAGFAVADVDRVLLTHFDLDHVGTLSKLDFEAPVHVAPADADLLTGATRPPLTNRKGLIQRASGLFLDRPDVDLVPVEDGDRIGPFVAHRTPGHTPGHTAYVHEGYGVAFVGDLVVEADGRLEPSPRIVTYDAERNEASIRSLAEELDEIDVVAMGHGDPIRADGGEKFRRLAGSLSVG